MSGEDRGGKRKTYGHDLVVLGFGLGGLGRSCRCPRAVLGFLFLSHFVGFLVWKYFGL